MSTIVIWLKKFDKKKLKDIFDELNFSTKLI